MMNKECKGEIRVESYKKNIDKHVRDTFLAMGRDRFEGFVRLMTEKKSVMDDISPLKNTLRAALSKEYGLPGLDKLR